MAGIYLHFPFCLSKCSYCDFYSIVYSEKLVSSYIQALRNEIQLYSDFFPKNKKIDTIYLGGGTPSLLKLERVKNIFNQIYHTFYISEVCEITIEVNPGNVSLDNLSGYENIGINRISIGAQSFIEDELNMMGRIHTVKDIKKICYEVQRYGIQNFGIDLIFGLPGQNITFWEYNLSNSLSLKPKHISTYALTWSSKTPLGRKIINGELSSPQEKIISEMFLAAHKILTKKGYEHYEISNYALPEYRCKHNEGYWSGKPYLGLGPSAHSFTGKKRYWNIRNVNDYISRLSRSVLPIQGEEVLTPDQKRIENIAIGLRMKEGIDIEENSIDLNRIEDFIKKGLVIPRGNKIALTPKGMLFTDEVALNLV